MKLLSLVILAGLACPVSSAPLAKEKPMVEEIDHDSLLDFDQKREPKPSGAWWEQRYVGAKQYDKLFIRMTHYGPMVLGDKPKGVFGDVTTVEVWADGTSPKLIVGLDKRFLAYTAETDHSFAYDLGHQMRTKEQLTIRLGTAVGNYVKTARPFRLVIRGRTATGKLVFEDKFEGDESSEYVQITPPRPY